MKHFKNSFFYTFKTEPLKVKLTKFKIEHLFYQINLILEPSPTRTGGIGHKHLSPEFDPCSISRRRVGQPTTKVVNFTPCIFTLPFCTFSILSYLLYPSLNCYLTFPYLTF